MGVYYYFLYPQTFHRWRKKKTNPKPLSYITSKLCLPFWVVNGGNKAELNICVSIALLGPIKYRETEIDVSEVLRQSIHNIILGMGRLGTK